MNILDEILKEMVKECEKDRNGHQDYASQEDLKNKVSKKEQAKQNNLNNTFHIDLNDMVKRINKEDNKNTNHQTLSILGKENKKEVVTDNRNLNKYDIVKIIDGEYKTLSDKECKFLDYVNTMDKVLIQTDEFNRLYVNPEDVELVRKAITQYDIKYSKKLSDIASMVIIDDTVVKNRYDEKLNLLVQTGDNIKIYCNDKINIMSYYEIIDSLYPKAKENIKVIKCWEE